MDWKQLLSFIGQHALVGAVIAGGSLSVTGHAPFTWEGLAVMGAAGLGSAASHLREAPGWGPPKA